MLATRAYDASQFMETNDPPSTQKTASESANQNPLTGKSILVVSIGSPKKAFILRKMKELGLTVVALHTEASEWAKPYVDHWILAKTGEPHGMILDKIHALCAEHPETAPQGAITFWEEDVPLLAAICEEFGWIGNTPETSMLTRSKFDMQEAFLRAGRNAIRQKLINNEQDLEAAIQSVGIPAIVKPLYGTDSLCVVYFNDAEEARLAYRYAKSQYTGPYEVLHTYDNRTFVYQEYIAGTEFSAECYVQNGVPHVVAIHQKTNMQLPFFMETGEITPARLASDVEAELREETEACLLALGVRNSLAHVEIKTSPRGPQIIEVGSRMGGDNIYSEAKEAFGIDLVEIGCKVALGVEVRHEPVTPKHTMNFYIIPQESGRIRAMRGFESLKLHPRVVDFHISKKVGDSILVPPEGFESIGWILIRGDSYADLQEGMKDVLQLLHVTAEPLASESHQLVESRFVTVIATS